MNESLYLLLVTLAAIFVLLVLVMRFKVHAFAALIIACMLVGIASGMPSASILQSMQDGMGSILGFVAVVVGLGSIFGQLLESSGGATALANKLLAVFGKDKAPWALTISGFLISIPVFLDIGFIILVPVVYALSRKSGKSTLAYAIPLLAGLAVTHAFIPPTPGPVAVSQVLDASLGWVVIFGFVIGIPTAILAGPVFGRYIATKIIAAPPEHTEPSGQEVISSHKPAQFRTVAFLIALPLVLIMVNTVVDFLVKSQTIPEEAFWVQVIYFLGHPFTALLIATMASAWLLGTRLGYSKQEVLDISNKALGPAGLIILVTGAGGMFKQILVDSGVGPVLAETMLMTKLSPLVLAYLLAVVIRLTQGSATVAMITAAGMIAPVLGLIEISEAYKALVVIVIAAGATTFSHVNDSGFWLVSKYLGITEKQTLASWSVMETIISVAGFIFALLVSLWL
ncbi:MAG: gluconate transporter [Cyclobacteriaceae bacterium]|nr:gluconate transporter [Cyclobacteriaceae bacterium]